MFGDAEANNGNAFTVTAETGGVDKLVIALADAYLDFPTIGENNGMRTYDCVLRGVSVDRLRRLHRHVQVTPTRIDHAAHPTKANRARDRSRGTRDVSRRRLPLDAVTTADLLGIITSLEEAATVEDLRRVTDLCATALEVIDEIRDVTDLGDWPELPADRLSVFGAGRRRS